MWWVVLTKQEIDDVEETLECAVLEPVSDRNERSRNPTCDANGVLDIQVRFHTRLVGTLWVLATV